MTVRRVMVVDPAWTLADDLPGVRAGAGEQLRAGGLGKLLDRVAATFDAGEGVLLLTDLAGLRLGAPVLLADDEDQADAPILASARESGWQTAQLRPWTTFRRDGSPRIHVGFLSLIGEDDRFLLRGLMHLDTMNRLASWHRFTGSAYHGNPGVAGDDMLRQLARGKRGAEPVWCPRNRLEIPAAADCERPFKVNGPFAWSRTEDAPAEISYDAVKAYLAAAGTVELSAAALDRRGLRRFDRKRSGFWLAELSPWNDKRIPDPAGYSPVQGPRWVTTPTLALLDDLTAQGSYGGFEVLDSLTGEGFRILRPWADRVRDLIFGDHPVIDGDDEGPAVLRMAGNEAYKATHGMIKQNGDRGRTRRADWYYSWLAQSRCNLWRKIWQAGNAGRWPLRVDVDNVWYSTDSRDSTPPLGFEVGDRLGQFTVKGYNVLKEALPV